ncbi:phophatidylserine decarboxylase associated domain-containing protein [Spiribacter onubensis]|uniref:Phophatidylserine decarboxylase associated domain-containing protein n=1 Tax=Spiribacter onubensis TaxID=3122420 RepID=A0ABV3S6R0_9GAMM
MKAKRMPFRSIPLGMTMALMLMPLAVSASDADRAVGMHASKYEHYVEWLRSLDTKPEPYVESVQALQDLIESDPGIQINMNRMIEQVPEAIRPARNVDELLGIMNGIIHKAPEYQAPSHFPMSALFVQMMYTPAGEYLLTNRELNAALKAVLDEWKAYLDSPDSVHVLNRENGWLSPESYRENDLDSFIIPDADDPHGGFESFNAFFHKRIKPELRPIAAPDDGSVVVLPSDGTVYKIEPEAKRTAKYWLKSEPYSLEEMLAGSPYTDRFVGGTIVQTFLSGNNYHRFNSPVSGEVVEARVIDGFMFSELRVLGFDGDAGIESQGYDASVNTRGLVIVKADDEDLGYVAFSPIGITEISSITLGVKPGDRVRKGDELGYFSYGGSTVTTLFEPDAVTLDPAIKEKSTVEANARFATAR